MEEIERFSCCLAKHQVRIIFAQSYQAIFPAGGLLPRLFALRRCRFPRLLPDLHERARPPRLHLNFGADRQLAALVEDLLGLRLRRRRRLLNLDGLLRHGHEALQAHHLSTGVPGYRDDFLLNFLQSVNPDLFLLPPHVDDDLGGLKVAEVGAVVDARVGRPLESVQRVGVDGERVGGS